MVNLPFRAAPRARAMTPSKQTASCLPVDGHLQFARRVPLPFQIGTPGSRQSRERLVDPMTRPCPRPKLDMPRPNWTCLGPNWTCLDPNWTCLDPNWTCLDPNWTCLDPNWTSELLALVNGSPPGNPKVQGNRSLQLAIASLT